MSNPTTEINNRIRIRSFFALAVRNNPMRTVLRVSQPSIVRTVDYERVLLTITIRWTVPVESELRVVVLVREASDRILFGRFSAAEILLLENRAPLHGFVDVAVGEGGAAAGHGGA